MCCDQYVFHVAWLLNIETQYRTSDLLQVDTNPQPKHLTQQGETTTLFDSAGNLVSNLDQLKNLGE